MLKVAGDKLKGKKNIKLMNMPGEKLKLKEAGRIYKFEFKITNFAYTPPFPESLIPLYDILDRIIHIVPILNRISVMLFISGSKL